MARPEDKERTYAMLLTLPNPATQLPLLQPLHPPPASSKSCLRLCSPHSTTGRLTRLEFWLTVCLIYSNYLRATEGQLTVAPVIMTPRMINAATSSQRNLNVPPRVSHHLDFATLGRTPLRLSLGSRRITSRDLQIVEATSELLQEDVPEPEGIASDVSLLRGFKATIPSAKKGKARRRQSRNVDVRPLGLRSLGTNAGGFRRDAEVVAAEISEDDVVLVDKKKGKWKPKRRGRQSLGAGKSFGKEELERQADEILQDKENLHVRRVSNDVA